MPKKNILVATENKKAVEYITDFYQDTDSIPTIIRAKRDLSAIAACHPDFMFIESDWAERRALSRIKELKESREGFRAIGLGNRGQSKFEWDALLNYPLEERPFRKTVYSMVTFPNPVKLLAVDDETEILESIQDYFTARKDVRFQVRTAVNGLEAFEHVKKDLPTCIIMDMKMPVRAGIDFYRDMRQADLRVPTIVFMDSTASDDIREIRRWGSAVFVEKGGTDSTLPELLALTKKIIAFS
jgi:CheY-like chemotaxis protein